VCMSAKTLIYSWLFRREVALSIFQVITSYLVVTWVVN
jgi:hypothetical protein